MTAQSNVDLVKSALGNFERLKALGAVNFVEDGNKVFFRFSRANPMKIFWVCVTLEARNRYRVDCFGRARNRGPSLTSIVGASGVSSTNLFGTLIGMTGIDLLERNSYDAAA